MTDPAPGDQVAPARKLWCYDCGCLREYEKRGGNWFCTVCKRMMIMTKEKSQLKFSEDWTKLDWPVFTTIRKPHPPYNSPEGTVFHAKTPTKELDALLLLNIETPLDALSDELLCYDTDSRSRDEALAKLNSFYRKAPTTVQLMLLRRCLA